VTGDLQSVLQNILTDNQRHREGFAQTFSRLVDACIRGDRNELGDIIGDITRRVDTGPEGGAGEVETGNTDGPAGDPIDDASPV
jgi:hypothetical protein